MAKIQGRNALRSAEVPGLRSYEKLIGFVRRRLRGSDEAADVVQDAYLRLAAASRTQEIANSEAFLFTAAVNLLNDRGRAAKTRAQVLSDDAVVEQVPAAEPLPDRQAADRAMLALVDRTIQEMSPARQAVLYLHRFEGLKQPQIAERLGISVSMVEKHISAAVATIRKRLEEADGDV